MTEKVTDGLKSQATRAIAQSKSSTVEATQPILQERSTIDPDEVLRNLKNTTNFDEYGEGLRLHHDFLGAGYIERLGRALKKSDKREAASYGVSKLHGEDFVLYGTNWGFMGGSTGVVAGEKFIEAIELAQKRNVPFVGIYASGGMRQDEDFAALEQLGRMIYFEEEFAQKSREPNIAVLVHRTYGGVSVALSIADVIVGMTGTDFGFAGPNVIESYTRTPVAEGAQSVEANYERRNIHFLVKDEAELHQWLYNMLHHSRHGKHAKLTPEAVEALPDLHPIPDHLRFAFAQTGYSSLITPTQQAREGMETQLFSDTHVEYDDLFKLYKALEKNPYRPDTEYLLRQIFTDAVPLYGKVSDGKMIKYPAIIAALGRIGEQSYLIIGDQPSYQKVVGRISKIPSSPSPEDFEYLEHMLELGRKLGIPAVLFTDTFGAKPTIESEERGQAGAIGRAIRAGVRYEPPLISINLGMLGSGGGLATTPRGDRRATLRYTLGCVAEPTSSAAIMLKRVPTDGDVAEYIPTMHATAEELHRGGFIDDVIDEPEGAWKNPVKAAENIRNYIAKSTIELQGQSWGTRRKNRRKMVRGEPGLPLQRD